MNKDWEITHIQCLQSSTASHSTTIIVIDVVCRSAQIELRTKSVPGDSQEAHSCTTEINLSRLVLTISTLNLIIEQTVR